VVAVLYRYTTSTSEGTDTGTNYVPIFVSFDVQYNSTTASTDYNVRYGVAHQVVLAGTPVDKKKQRDELRFKNKWSFLNFVDWVTRPRFTRRLRLPCADKAYGTTNGLRPVPMLC